MSEPPKAKFTSFTTTKGCLAKTFGLDEDGKLTKKRPGKISKGSYSVHNVGLARLQKGLRNLTNKQCICLGTPDHREGGSITWNKDHLKRGCPDDPIPRSADYFKFKPQPTFFLIDVDGINQPLDDIINKISMVVPGFAESGRLIVNSSSSGIHNKEGILLKDSTSAHIYLIVEDGTDIPRFMGVLFDRLWLNGLGRIMVSSSGSMLVRCIIDDAVKGPERIIYEADPVLKDGLIQNRPESEYLHGMMLDTSLLLNLTAEEQEQLKQQKDDEKDKTRPASELIGKQYDIDHVDKLIKRRNITKEHAVRVVASRKNHLLEDDDILYFDDGEFRSVGEVLTKGESYHGKSLADPLEPDYNGGSTTTARFFWNDGNPVINSFCHGGAKYRFVSADGGILLKKDKKKEKDKEENKTEIAESNKTLAMMLRRFVYMRNGNIVADLDKPQQHALMRKEEFTTAFRTLGKIFLNGNDKPVKAVDAFFDDPRRKAVVGERYYPGREKIFSDEGVNWFNPFYMPEFVYTDKRDKIGLIVDHFDYLFPEEKSRFMCWLAWTLLEPCTRVKFTPLLIARHHGTGRGFVVELIHKLLGQWNCTAVEMPTLAGQSSEGQYHNYLHNTIFCSLPEVKVAGADAFAVDDKIRSKLTEDTLPLNLKYGGNGTYPVFTNFLMMTNHMNALVLTKADRRMEIFEHFHEPKKEQYYTDLYLAIEDTEALTQVYSWLVDVKKKNEKSFNPKGRALMSKAKLRLIGGGDGNIDTWFEFYLSIVDADVVTFTAIKEAMVQMYREEVKDDNNEAVNYINEKKSQIVALVKSRCGKCLEGKQMRYGTGRVRVWAVKNLEFWVNTEDRDKIKEELDKSLEESPF